MRKMNLHKTILYVTILFAMLLSMSGCGKEMDKDTQMEQTESEWFEDGTRLLITEHDAQEGVFGLYSFEDGIQRYYQYGFSTKFADKYGNYASTAEFTEGRFVSIGPRDKDGYLTEVQISDQVWEYEKVKRFQIDEEKEILTIGNTKYSIRDKVKIFSNGKQIDFSEISPDDVLKVAGVDRKVLSIVVTTGHGTLSLKNTTLFEESFLQLNTNVFAMITPDMELEVPEGTYTLKVANDGWGGSTEIEILRGKTTEIDLDTLKGEGKKKGLVSFDIDVEEVKVYVDYQLIDHTKPIELTYGTHVLKIEAEGYDSWKKYLSVNSEEATLIIELTEEGEKKDSKEEDTESKEEKKDSETEASESLESTEI